MGVCVCEKERETERQRESERGREALRSEGMCDVTAQAVSQDQVFIRREGVCVREREREEGKEREIQGER